MKHCAMNILYSLQHLGYVIPPQADAGWIGEAGPGPSYLDPGSGGPENDFTNRNTTFMTWNLLHLARMLEGRRRHPRPRQPALASGTPAAASTSPTPNTAERPARRRRQGQVRQEMSWAAMWSAMGHAPSLVLDITVNVVPAARVVDRCGTTRRRHTPRGSTASPVGVQPEAEAVAMGTRRHVAARAAPSRRPDSGGTIAAGEERLPETRARRPTVV